jgi:hypothetical protein
VHFSDVILIAIEPCEHSIVLALIGKRPEWAVRGRLGTQVSINLASGHLRSGEIVLRCGEIPGQQLMDAVDGMIGDLFEHAA